MATATVAYAAAMLIGVWYHTRISGTPSLLTQLVSLGFVALSTVAFFLVLTLLRRNKIQILAASEEQLRLLVEGASRFFFYVQDLGGDVTYVSPSVAAITGRSVEEWLGQQHWFTTDNPVNDVPRAATHQHLRGELANGHTIAEIYHASGHPILLEIHEYPLYRDGRLSGIQGFAHDITEENHAARRRKAVDEIVRAASTAVDVDALFGEIHHAVADLIPTTNLYIAIRDNESGLLHFPYFVDERDETPLPRRSGRGLTEYVMRTGAPLLASPEIFDELCRKGEVERLGSDPIDWVGAPLISDGVTFGVIAVQTYASGVRFGERERDLLEFVSSQIALAVRRRQALDDVERSEKELREILENVSLASIRLDVQGTITLCSTFLLELAGWRHDEVIGADFFETFIPDETREEVAGKFRNGMTGGYLPNRSEFEIRLRSGERRRFMWSTVIVRSVSGAANGAASIGEDVTELRRHEAALRESEERYRRLIELSPDAIAIHSGGKVVYANDQAARMFGLESPEHLVGKPSIVFVHPDHRAKAIERISRSLETGESQPLAEEVFLRADGSTIPVEVAATPFLFEGRPSMLVVVRDISLRYALEDQLRRAQRLEAVGRLAGGIAHDFNNILQVLLSSLQVLRLRTGDPEWREQALDEVETHIRRGASLTRQLLLFSRREVVKLETLDLNLLVRDASMLLRRLIRENIDYRQLTTGEALLVQADRGQLEQVLVNLVVNAVDAIDGEGEITLVTGAEDGAVFFEVRDSGSGMTEEVLGTIFDPFFSTKSADKGTGLGLAVVHGIISGHGGRIEVESHPGTGSTFRVTLPGAAGVSTKREDRLQASDAVPRGHGERVLLVEDENGTREVLHEMLELLDYRVRSVASGNDAIAAAQDETFDVILTDLLLPGPHGGEVATRLRERMPHLGVIIMSGYTEDEVVRHEVRAGNVRFLQKPFALADLAKELREVLTANGGTGR